MNEAPAECGHPGFEYVGPGVERCVTCRLDMPTEEAVRLAWQRLTVEEQLEVERSMRRTLEAEQAGKGSYHTGGNGGAAH